MIPRAPVIDCNINGLVWDGGANMICFHGAQKFLMVCLLGTPDLSGLFVMTGKEGVGVAESYHPQTVPGEVSHLLEASSYSLTLKI